MSKVIVFDIDGTIADTTHRQHFVRTKPKNWKAFTAGIPFDPPHEDVIWLLHSLHELGNTILLASGREEATRLVTCKWLGENFVPFRKLYMRQTGDNRKDSIVKTEILEQMRLDGYEPYMVFDDRNQTVKAWRDAGLRCFQVCDGDF